MVRTFADIEELVGAATKVERVIGELGETPYEPLREEQEEETSESNMEKQVNALNNTFINFFRENVLNPASSSYSIMFEGCQICRRRDHVATTCPRLNEAQLRYAKCNMPHWTANSGSEHTFCAELGHSEDKSWKRPNDGRSHFEAANFIKVLLHDEEATEGIGIGRKLEDAATPYEEPRAELNNTKKEHLNAAEDKISVEVVKTIKEIDNIPELNEEAATIQQDQAPLAVEETDEQIHQAADDQIAAEPVGIVRDLKKTTTLVAEDINIKGELDAEMGKPFTSALPPSAFEDYPVNPRMIVRCTDEQQTQVTQATSKLVDVLVEASKQGDSYSRAEHGMEVRGDDRRVEAESVKLPDNLVAPDHSSMISMQVTCQRPQGHDDNILRTVSRNAYKQHPYMQEFGSSISNRLANVEARTLPPLWLKYCDTGWEKNCLPSIGLWNMMHRKMVNGGVVKHWACINFSRCVTADIAHQCCNELTQMFRTSRMVFGMNPVPTIQGAKPEQCDNAYLTDYEQARVVVPESYQPLSDMEVVVFNKKIVQDKFEETSSAAGDCKVDPDGITETPNVTLKGDCSLKMEELCTYPSPFIAEEPSLGERIVAGSIEEPTCSTRI